MLDCSEKLHLTLLLVTTIKIFRIVVRYGTGYKNGNLQTKCYVAMCASYHDAAYIVHIIYLTWIDFTTVCLYIYVYNIRYTSHLIWVSKYVNNVSGYDIDVDIIIICKY